MAQTYSFDVTTGVDLQEVDNAVNQAQKEIAQRYDFKGSKAAIDFQRGESVLALVADSEFQMTALFDVADDQPMNDSSARARLTWRRRLSAFSLICRTRSRVIPRSAPICSSVIGSSPSSPK